MAKYNPRPMHGYGTGKPQQKPSTPPPRRRTPAPPPMPSRSMGRPVVRRSYLGIILTIFALIVGIAGDLVITHLVLREPAPAAPTQNAALPAGSVPAPPVEQPAPPRPPAPAPKAVPQPRRAFLFTEDTRVAPPDTPHEPRTPLPQPEPVRAILARKHDRTGPIYKVNFAFAGPHASQALTPDGRTWFVADGGNVLHRINLDTLTPEARLRVGSPVGGIGRSASGLVLTLPAIGVVWIVDESTLEVKHEIPIPGVTRIAAAPQHPVAWAVAKSGFHAIDTAKAVITHTVSYRNDEPRALMPAIGHAIHPDQRSMYASPDGRYLFTANGRIHRFAVSDQGRQLTWEESSGNLDNGRTAPLSISLDGRWAAIPTGAGNGDAIYHIAVFDSQSLSRHAISLPVGAYPEAVGWDPVTGNMLSNDFDHWKLFTPRAGLIHEVDRRRGATVLQVIGLPVGQRYLVWRLDGIQLLDFDGDRLRSIVDAAEAAFP